MLVEDHNYISENMVESNGEIKQHAGMLVWLNAAIDSEFTGKAEGLQAPKHVQKALAHMAKT